MDDLVETIIGDGDIKFSLNYSDHLSDQGVNIAVLAVIDDDIIELLRFDCFDHQPHYHYGPSKSNKRFMLDQTTEGDPVEWALLQIGENLPAMLNRSGYVDISNNIDMQNLGSTIETLGVEARKMARDGRSTVKHNRGDIVVEAGKIRIGLEFREISGDRGVAVHVLGDVGDDEVEMLAFDCFEKNPHYHYGPRAKNQRLSLDTTTIPDPLRWTLDLFKGGKLGSMLERAGYRDHATGINPNALMKALNEVESHALKMREAHS